MKLLSSILFFLIINSLSYAQTWHSVSNINGYANMLKVVDNELFIVGVYSHINGIKVNGISKFDGIKFDSLAGGFFNVYGLDFCFENYHDNYYLGGGFSGLNSDYNIKYLAKWDGTTWYAFNQYPNYDVKCLKKSNNKLYVGGRFLSIGGTSYKYIASWNDTAWSSVGGGLTGGGSASTGIYCMEEYMGDLIVGGVFTKMGSTPANNIARWDGSSWHALAGGVDGMVSSLCIDSINNILYVGGGIFNADTVSVRGIAGWNGTNWFAPGQGITNGALSMTMFDNKLYVGGLASTFEGINDTTLAYWDGNEWFRVAGPYGDVKALAVYKGNLFAGGNFKSVLGDTTMKYLACYGDSCPLSVNTTNINISKSFLGNNIPNPSKGTTIIPYNLPIGKEGKIKIHSINGVLKKQYSVSPESKNLEIDTTGWQKGSYIYSLYIEGKQIESRKMVVQ